MKRWTIWDTATRAVVAWTISGVIFICWRDAFAQSTTAELARPPAPVTALKQGRNVIISGTTEAMVSAYLMELPQSPRDGQKPACNDAAQGYVWFTRGSAAADSRTEVCEWRGGTIAWRVK